MFTTRTKLIFAIAIAVLFWGYAIPTTHAAEKAKVKAPDAVLNSFHKAYPDAVIRDISEETKGNQKYYEIESMDGNVRRDLLYLPDGTVYEIEEALSLDNLPGDIGKSLKAEFPHGEPQKAEKITHGKTIEYEVLMENSEENLEILLDQKGNIISQATVSDNDEKSENNEGDEPDKD